MGQIQAPLDDIERVGAGIEAVAPTLMTLARAATGVTGTVSDPPTTSAALDQMASRWSASATRLQDEIAALGVAAGATAVAYRTADESSMTGGSAAGAAAEGAGPGELVTELAREVVEGRGGGRPGRGTAAVARMAAVAAGAELALAGADPSPALRNAADDASDDAAVAETAAGDARAHADAVRSRNTRRAQEAVDIDIPTPDVDVHQTLPLPAGNLSDFDDRWGRIENDMLPRYHELLQDPHATRTLVSSDVAERAADRRKLPDLHYPGG